MAIQLKNNKVYINEIYVADYIVQNGIITIGNMIDEKTLIGEEEALQRIINFKINLN